MKEEPQIIYKRDFNANRCVLKPDTRYWRFRYWLNQYVALLTALIIKPVVRLNQQTFRLQDGEEYTAMYDVWRMGIRIIETPNIYRFHVPFWVRRNNEYLQKAFHYLRNL